MNLKSRLDKLEAQAGMGEDGELDPVEAERRRVLYDPEFIRLLFAASNTILASLSAEHYNLVRAEVKRVRDWHESDGRGDYPELSALARFFLSMVCDRLEGFYKGPLEIPAVIARFLVEQKQKNCWSHNECERCFYPVPFVVGSPFCPDGGRVRSGHCPLCGGDVGMSDVPHSPSVGYYRRAALMKRAGGIAIITSDIVAHYLACREPPCPSHAAADAGLEALQRAYDDQ
jgi:hypothetical protein